MCRGLANSGNDEGAMKPFLVAFSLFFGSCNLLGWSGGLPLLATVIACEVYRRRNGGKKTSTLSPLTLIQLAHGSYLSLKDPLPMAGWSRLNRHFSNLGNHHEREGDIAASANTSQGPCIDVFHNNHKKILVLSVRGTDPSLLGDLQQDMKLFCDRVQAFVEGRDRHELPKYAIDLLKIMTASQARYPDCQLYLTGHSLGAACCEAAWLADLKLKTETGQHGTDDGTEYCLWKCVTWESPGFAVPAELQQVLNRNRDTLDTHVVHYLGAPNVINCLHPHISSNRRYRIFLEHDNRLTCWHVMGCLWRDAVVLMNWMSVIRGAASLGAKVSLQTAQAAEEAAAIAADVPFSWKLCTKPRQLWKYAGNKFHKIWVTPSCPDAGANFRAVADVLSKYDAKLGNAQVKIAGWFANIMPIGDKLTWTIVRGNVLMQGEKAVDYLLRQHSLLNHIDSFDIRSGYPLRWVQVQNWPTLTEMITRTVREGLRSSFIPNTPSEHFNPAVEIENSIQRLSGYQERRLFTADHQVLKDTYDYLGDGFFDEIIGVGFGFRKPLNELEEKCRQEYIRCNRQLPSPVYIVG